MGRVYIVVTFKQDIQKSIKYKHAVLLRLD